VVGVVDDNDGDDAASVQQGFLAHQVSHFFLCPLMFGEGQLDQVAL